MCHICRRLGIVVQSPPPEVVAAQEAEEEAQERRFEEELARLRAEGKPIQAPRKQLPGSIPPTKVVVEPAPSHDSAPTFAAYSVFLHLLQADPDTENGYSNSPPTKESEKHRPKFGIRIYDTTSNATAQRAALLARRISELTWDYRTSRESFQEDRIEIVVLPLPTSSSAEDLAATCIAHNEAERQARLRMSDAEVAASWYIAEDFTGNGWWKALWVIYDLGESWEEALQNTTYMDGDSLHGRFLGVRYEKTAYYPVEDEDEPPRDFLLMYYRLEQMGWVLSNFRGTRGNVWTFYTTHFIPDKVLDKELDLARATAAGLDVPRPVVVPYYERERW
ncbi:hypothetical protein B0I37DRAFT_384611 [Chaetomium sp. MPI-CAGE-AT-0009]|nr:hypothetical protein B0I37DRAFT_384611 [Chaetomium sp. MPI-CAGE-AT-0009]